MVDDNLELADPKVKGPIPAIPSGLQRAGSILLLIFSNIHLAKQGSLTSMSDSRGGDFSS